MKLKSRKSERRGERNAIHLYNVNALHAFGDSLYTIMDCTVIAPLIRHSFATFLYPVKTFEL